MGKTWGEQHTERQRKRGTPTRWGARKARASTDGMMVVCKNCKGSGRKNGFTCSVCWGREQGLIDK